MRIPVIIAVVMLVLQLIIDVYLFFIAWQRSRKLWAAKFQLIQGAFFIVYAIVLICLPKRSSSDSMLLVAMWMIFFYLMVYTAKLLFIIFDLLSYLPELFHKPRAKWLSYTGMAMAIATVLVMSWGAFINRFAIKVNEIPVAIENLPPGFKGYRIAQISDLHVGTFGQDTTFVSKLVDRVNSLHPDMIVFTGDLVNRHSEELRPFIKPLSRLDAPDGIYSILGNHDYGDYYTWTSDHDKERDLEKLIDMQLSMHWLLMTNTSEIIPARETGDSIVIIGVENQGDPPFPRRGDLKLSYPALDDPAVKILLTHNPIHWIEDVENADSVNIALTLSGHTHAMQISAWHHSPSSFRYSKWGGAYYSRDGKRMLYINTGVGTVGFPMRIGATPEISIFTLQNK